MVKCSTVHTTIRNGARIAGLWLKYGIHDSIYEGIRQWFFIFKVKIHDRESYSSIEVQVGNIEKLIINNDWLPKLKDSFSICLKNWNINIKSKPAIIVGETEKGMTDSVLDGWLGWVRTYFLHHLLWFLVLLFSSGLLSFYWWYNLATLWQTKVLHLSLGLF